VGRGFPDFFQNVVQTAFLEGRRALWNDAGSTDDFDTTTHVGKFFPRGARGFIGSVKAYLRNLAGYAQTAKFRIAIYPGAPYIHEVTLEQDAGTTGWVSTKLNAWWNYDSLFIYVEWMDWGISLGYDTGTPYDSFAYDSATDKWEGETKRRYLRVDVQGQTPGDVPVSGTLNTVIIPSVTSDFNERELTVSPGATEDAFPPIEGSGWVRALHLRTAGVASSKVKVIMIIDGVALARYLNYLLTKVAHRLNTPTPLTFFKIDDTTLDYGFALNFPISFRRGFRLQVKNEDTAASLTSYSFYSYELIV